jgi:hypothetical protein
MRLALLANAIISQGPPQLLHAVGQSILLLVQLLVSLLLLLLQLLQGMAVTC